MDEYCSLATVSEGLYREKGSKFLAFAFPVTSEAEVEERLAQLRHQHAGARHHCYAFVLKSHEGEE
ncbi:MAG: YigZ family protein [Tunicatimonas sp.]